ncbi:hypothetical protein GmHk_19G054430 [Glycine max]|nr:hypothetical protein GmHk_19G054430 [Glycine max]
MKKGGLGLNPPKPDGCGPYHSLLVWDMLGAPSNSLKASSLLSSPTSFFSARLLRQPLDLFAFEIMARTQGLGRAIGRVVGRDRPADEDVVDVPERRRPTASSRRLRVHQMTTE